MTLHFNSLAAMNAAQLWLLLADLAVKGAIVLMAAWASTFALRRASSAARHLIWTLAVSGTLLLPVLSALLPAWPVLPAWMRQEQSMAAAVSPHVEQPADSGSRPRDLFPLEQLATSLPKDDAATGAIPQATDIPKSALPSPAALPTVPRSVPPAIEPQPRTLRSWTQANWQWWLLIAWASGTAIMLSPILLSLLGLWRLGRRATPITGGSWDLLLRECAVRLNVRRRVMLLRGRRKGMPMTWGFVRPRLLLSPDADGWPTDRRRVVLMHELAHIKRGDFLAQLIVQIARAVYWFNPLMWIAAKQMAVESEGACDDLVLSQKTRASDYAEHLLTVAAGLKDGALIPLAAIAMARSSRLEGRLLAILDAKRNRRKLTVTGIVLAVAVLLGGVLPLAMLRAAHGDDAPAKDPAVATRPAADSAWLTGTWIHQRTDNPGPTEPTCYILTLRADRSWMSSAIWGTPQAPVKSEVYSRGQGFELGILRDDQLKLFSGSEHWLPKPEYTLKLPLPDGSLLHLGAMARKDADTIVFHNFESIHWANTYAKASPQLEHALQDLLVKSAEKMPAMAAFDPLVEEIRRLIGANFPDAVIHVSPDSFSAQHAAREFQIDDAAKAGAVPPGKHKQTGPADDGFILSLTRLHEPEMRQAAVPQVLNAPCWKCFINSSFDPATKQGVSVEFNFGANLKPEFKTELMKLLKGPLLAEEAAHRAVLEAQLQRAKGDLARRQKLFEIGAIKASDLQDSKDEVELLEAELTGDAVQVETARVEAARRHVHNAVKLFKAGALTNEDLEKTEKEFLVAKTRLLEAKARKQNIKEQASGLTFQAIAVDSQTGNPVPNVRLWSPHHKGAEGTSDKDGNVAIGGMTPGHFTFQIQASGYLGRSSIGNFNYWELEMTDHMAPFKIELERVVRITGVVQDPDGNPVAGATVAPADGTGNSLTGDTSFSVATAKDGTFVMELPPSGAAKYNIEAHDGNQGQWRKWANGVLPQIQTKPGDEFNNVVIKLTRPATVRGHMKDETGKPLAGRDVRASAADKLENRYYDPTTKTDKNGDFELRFIRPGEQFIQAAPFFWCNVPEDGMTLEFKEGETNSRPVTLKEGETKVGVQLTAPASTKFPSDEEQLRRAIERSVKSAKQPKAKNADAGKKEGRADEQEHPDIANLKHEWQVQSVSGEGTLGSHQTMRVGDAVHIEMVGMGTGWLVAGVDYYVVNPLKDPKEFDLTFGSQLENVFMTQRGIYKIEGDTLTLCVASITKGLVPIAEARPNKFAAEAGKSMLIVLKRARPAATQPTERVDAQHVIEVKVEAARRELKITASRFTAGLADSLEYQAAKDKVQILEAELTGDPVRVAEARLVAAREQLKISESQFKAGLITDLDFEKAKSNVAIAEAELRVVAEKAPPTRPGNEGAARPAGAPPKTAAARAQAMKANIQNFKLDLQYNGPQDKPYYRLQLITELPGKARPDPFVLRAIITDEQAKKVIDYLAAEGFLDAAHNLQEWDFVPKATEPGYSLTVLDYYSDLGWKMPMLKRLDGLKSVLEGDAAAKMDVLLGRLSGHRNQWTQEGRADERQHSDLAKSIELSGHVVDDDTGKPISNFGIQGGHVDDKDPAKIIWGYSLESRGSNPTGEFSDNIKWTAGWRSRIVAGGYVSQPVLTELPKDGAAKFPGLVVRMKRGRQVSGHVLDYIGRPVKDAGVYVVGGPSINLSGGRATELAGGFEVDPKAVRVATGIDGAFTVTGIGEDAQRIAVTSSALDLWVVPVPEGDAATVNLEIHLPQPGKLIVHYDVAGAADKTKLLLQLHTWEMPGWSGVSNDRDDAIQQHVELALDNLPPGDYTIDRTKDQGAKGRWGQALLDRRTIRIESGKTVVTDFARPRGAPITGQVVGLDEGDVAKAKPTCVYVRVQPVDEKLAQSLIYDALSLEPGNQPMDGKFTTERIPPGQYKVRVAVLIPETEEQRHSTGIVPPAFEGEVLVTVPEQGQPEPVKIQLAPFKSTPPLGQRVQKSSATPFNSSTLQERGLPAAPTPAYTLT